MKHINKPQKLRSDAETGITLNSFVVIFAFLILAAILTYVVPAGTFDRQENAAGQQVVLPDSFRYTEQSPVSPVAFFACIGEAFVGSADIIFCILFACCFVGTLVRCGVINALFCTIIRKLRGQTELLLVMVTLIFGVMGSVAGLAEETFGLFPVCISLAIAMGYDRIVGSAIVYLAIFTGFAAATFNPYTIGVAQAIAGVPLYSGLGFRVLCFVIFMGILLTYLLIYARRVKQNPARSLLAGIPESSDTAELQDVHITPRQTVSAVIFGVVMFLIVFGAIRWGWYLNEIIGIFLLGTVTVGLVNGWKPSRIADEVVEIGGDAMFSMLIIGFSNAISVILTHGSIIDTIVYAMANLLRHTTGYASAVVMLVIQNLLNFFIPSGPGQAAVSMPIMAAFADVTGLSRQLSVLAFQFGDGFSNIFWPTMVFMMCGIIKVPVGKWYRFVTPLFGLFFLAQVVLICLAVRIGY